LLDFSMEVSLDGERLSAAEVRDLLKGADGLQLIRGRWVEVDDKMTAAGPPVSRTTRLSCAPTVHPKRHVRLDSGKGWRRKSANVAKPAGRRRVG
jgi:hypothetical protein